MILGRQSKIAATGSDISANVTIGNYTSVGPYVQMHSLTQHACIQNRNLVSTAQIQGYPQTHSEEKMTIGSDVWIGRNAVILGNITIGHGAIIGAFAVVAKDVPPFSVVVGNPCQIKRFRFTEDQIEKLLQIQWWNWDDETIQERVDDLSDVSVFVDKWYNPS